MTNRTPGPPPGWEPTAADTASAHRILDDSTSGPTTQFLYGAMLATLRIVAAGNPPASLPPGSVKAIRLAFALDAAADDLR